MTTYLGLFHCGSGATLLRKWGDYTIFRVGRLHRLPAPEYPLKGPFSVQQFSEPSLTLNLRSSHGKPKQCMLTIVNFAFSFKLRCNFVNLLL